MKRRREIELPDVEALVGSLLRAGESIESTHQDRADKLSVFLTERDPEMDRVIEKFGLGGCGRAMGFAYKSGRWTFIGEGVWRS